MRVNREIGRIESSLGRAHRLGRILGVAFDVSKGQTPFSQRQINRVLAMGWIMVGFTLFCLAWSPLVSVIDLSLGGAEYLIYPSEQAAGLDVNFETLIAAGAFFLFAYILSYGKTLQELADEAL